MSSLEFNGVLKEIAERYPNIDIVSFLQENLEITQYKAEILAARIEKQYCQKMRGESTKTLCIRMFDRPEKSELKPNGNIFSVESLSDSEFEHFILWLFYELGYEVGLEKHQSISGVDFVVSKNSQKIVVQARKYPENCRVSDSIVLLAQEAKRSFRCEQMIVLVTAYFSEQAIAAAQKWGVELWDKETLDRKILEVKKNVGLAEKRVGFPQYKNSLLQSLCRLDETEDFIVEQRTEGKYDLYLTNVKFPLLTFQANSEMVTRCIFRIKNNHPVGELEGVTLIGSDKNNLRVGPDGIQAYTLIIQYLKEFLG